MKQNEFNALVVVIGVAFMSMGLVAVLGGVYDLLNPKVQMVQCTVRFIDSNNVTTDIVGEGRLYD